MDNQKILTKDSEVCKVIPSTLEKFVVDFANGINVSKDHIRLQKKRTKFFQRFSDGITGQGKKRQIEINQNLSSGLETSFEWLNELTASLAKTNFAISQICDHVSKIDKALVKLINYSADTRELVYQVNQNLTSRMNQLETDTRRMDLEIQAGKHLELVISRWSGCRLDNLSLGAKVFVTLEELKWGAFGEIIRRGTQNQRSHYFELSKNKIFAEIKRDAGIGISDRCSSSEWLLAPTSMRNNLDYIEAVEYIGDWSTASEHPFVYTIANCPHDLPCAFPRRLNATRVVDALSEEIFNI